MVPAARYAEDSRPEASMINGSSQLVKGALPEEEDPFPKWGDGRYGTAEPFEVRGLLPVAGRPALAHLWRGWRGGLLPRATGRGCRDGGGEQDKQSDRGAP